MEKIPSEISKWLDGDHNLTLRSIAKLEAELGVELLCVSKEEAFAAEISKQIRVGFQISEDDGKEAGETKTAVFEKRFKTTEVIKANNGVPVWNPVVH